MKGSNGNIVDPNVGHGTADLAASEWNSQGPTMVPDPVEPTEASHWLSTSARTAAQPASSVVTFQPANRPHTPLLTRNTTGKQTSAWGGATGASSVVRAKAPPGSVAVAAANTAPQTGSATKYMAREQKQKSAKAQQRQEGKGKGKKKQNSELRQLAFG